MVAAKEGGEDVNNWSMQELVQVVEAFVETNKPAAGKSSDTTVNNSMVESRPADAFARLTEMQQSGRVDCKQT